MRIKRITCWMLAAALYMSTMCMGAQAVKMEAAPYPSVEFLYTTTVTPGTVRYICQDPDNGYFYKNYWGTWADSAKHECLTASISMALSYIGVDATPQTILDKGSGTTMHAYAWGGSTYLKTGFDVAFSNYLNGNGKYSPPIIHLANYSSGGHYLLVIAKQGANTYAVADPFQSTMWTLNMSGTTATYNYYGAAKTDTVSDAMQYYYNNGGIQSPSASSEKTLVFSIGSSTYKSNGVEKNMDVSPYLKSSRTYLPARFVSEELDAEIEWEAATGTVTIAKGTTVMKLTVGSNAAYLNGVPVTLDAAPEISGGRTCLPIRFVAENLGASVSWSQSAGTVTVIRK